MALSYGRALVVGTRAPHVNGRPAAETVFDLAPDPSLAQGLCVGMDPDLFFPDDGDAVGIARAKNLCAACPVVAACLTGALRRRERFGVFGGLTGNERANFVRRGKLPSPIPCGTAAGYARHRRLKEPTCPACRAAVATLSRERDQLRRQTERGVAA